MSCGCTAGGPVKSLGWMLGEGRRITESKEAQAIASTTVASRTTRRVPEQRRRMRPGTGLLGVSGRTFCSGSSGMAW